MLLHEHNAIINSLACNEDGVLVSGEAGIFALTFDQSGSRLITAEADKTIKMYKENENPTKETHHSCAEMF
ncbi:unnamed protein product [Onchocerca flexuosa]|uniref:WD_REPEATS_REGION domain-containing protein n=1 Tax=Onchocerca flexuosa TaxID=387005 RepID=A0A183HJK1_9BILA|nr:unnamed protein product [Onchocerca flexuosa]